MDEVLMKDGTRKRNLVGFSRSQSTKHAWRRKRSSFQIGINRYNRNRDHKDLVSDAKKRISGTKNSALDWRSHKSSQQESLASRCISEMDSLI